MADWYAALPILGAWLVGGSEHIDARGIARVLFCEHEGRMILLHAFIKKTQKTPAGDLELAIKRKKEIA
jgi:phage-related protein